MATRPTDLNCLSSGSFRLCVADPALGQSFGLGYEFLYRWDDRMKAALVYRRLDGFITDVFDAFTVGCERPSVNSLGRIWQPTASQVRIFAEAAANKRCEKRNGCSGFPDEAMIDEIDSTT